MHGRTRKTLIWGHGGSDGLAPRMEAFVLLLYSLMVRSASGTGGAYVRQN